MRGLTRRRVQILLTFRTLLFLLKLTDAAAEQFAPELLRRAKLIRIERVIEKLA
jgi:hypothetical protein